MKIAQVFILLSSLICANAFSQSISTPANATDQYLIGARILDGTDGERRDAKKAAGYFLKAAAAGQTQAMLGLCRIWGTGELTGRRDFVMAYAWCWKAYALGAEAAYFGLRELEKHLTDQQLFEAISISNGLVGPKKK